MSNTEMSSSNYYTTLEVAKILGMAVRSVQLVLGRLADAINEGRHGAQDQRGNDDDA